MKQIGFQVKNMDIKDLTDEELEEELERRKSQGKEAAKPAIPDEHDTEKLLFGKNIWWWVHKSHEQPIMYHP